MNSKVARVMLEDVHATLSTLSLKHFLIDGTLLGAVRNRAFITYDNDMDIGVFAEEWTPEVIGQMTEAMMKRGILIYHMFGDLNKYFEIALKRNGIKCDLFFYRRDGDDRIFHAFRNGGQNMPADVITYWYPASMIENLGTIKFLGKDYPAPADPVAVLVHKYGKEWKIPNKDWDWADSPYNKVELALI